MFKRVAFFPSFLVVLLFFPSSALGLGVTPARHWISFEPGVLQSSSFEIINNEHKNLDLALDVSGELASYIQLPQSSLTLSSSDASYTLPYTIRLPGSLDHSGESTGMITIRETPVSSSSLGTSITASLAVTTQVLVSAPSSGSSALLTVATSESSDVFTFLVTARNTGMRSISSARLFVEVVDDSQNRVALLTAPSFSLEVRSSSTRSLLLETDDVAPGAYNAIVTLEYDESVTSTEQPIIISASSYQPFRFDAITAPDFSLGAINPLDVILFNEADASFADASLLFAVLDAHGSQVSTFSSPRFTLAPQTSSFRAYWDTSGVLPGAYTLRTTLLAGTYIVNRDVPLDITERTFSVDLSQDSAYLLASPASFIILSLFLVALIFISFEHYIRRPL